jgi:hypothetical protein
MKRRQVFRLVVEKLSGGKYRVGGSVTMGGRSSRRRWSRWAIVALAIAVALLAAYMLWDKSPVVASLLLGALAAAARRS